MGLVDQSGLDCGGDVSEVTEKLCGVNISASESLEPILSAAGNNDGNIIVRTDEHADTNLSREREEVTVNKTVFLDNSDELDKCTKEAVVEICETEVNTLPTVVKNLVIDEDKFCSSEVESAEKSVGGCGIFDKEADSNEDSTSEESADRLQYDAVYGGCVNQVTVCDVSSTDVNVVDSAHLATIESVISLQISTEIDQSECADVKHDENTQKHENHSSFKSKSVEKAADSCLPTSGMVDSIEADGMIEKPSRSSQHDTVNDGETGQIDASKNVVNTGDGAKNLSLPFVDATINYIQISSAQDQSESTNMQHDDESTHMHADVDARSKSDSVGDDGEGRNEYEDEVDEHILDDDQIVGNPAYIPKSGKYYMHDKRDLHEITMHEQQQVTRSRADGVWKHDRFDEKLQRPKYRQIVAEECRHNTQDLDRQSSKETRSSRDEAVQYRRDFTCPRKRASRGRVTDRGRNYYCDEGNAGTRLEDRGRGHNIISPRERGGGKRYSTQRNADNGKQASANSHLLATCFTPHSQRMHSHRTDDTVYFDPQQQVGRATESLVPRTKKRLVIVPPTN